MDFAKLTRAHVVIIGVVIALILGGGFYALGFRKTNENLATLKGRLDTAEGTISQRAKFQKQLDDAKREVAEAKAKYALYKKTKMPKPPIDLRAQDPKGKVLAMMNLWAEPRRLYHLAQDFALSTDKVAVRTQFGVPAQPSDPSQIPTTIIELPLGTVTAIGTLDDVLAYFKRWNQFSRVVAVDNLVLDGTAPLLQGTATLTAYIFPEVNPDQVAQTATDTSGYGTGYGYPGGYGGPGGPPGMGGPYGPGYGPPAGGPGGAPNGP
jgi:hypothetical protein